MNGNSRFKLFLFLFFLGIMVVAFASKASGRFNWNTLSRITPTYNPTYASKTPTSTSTATGTATFTATPSPTSTATPTQTPTPPLTFKAQVTQPSHCYNGPNETYLGAIIVPADTVVDILGMNSDSKDWFMIDGETIDACWIRRTFLHYNADPEKILILTTAFTTEDSACLIYPSVGRRTQTYIPQGWRIVINAKSAPDANWLLVTPHNSTAQCWVAREKLTSFSDTELPPVVSDALVVANPPAATNTRRNTGGGNNSSSTARPPTSGPGTPVPPTQVPPTQVPPTAVPPTVVQPTATLCWPPGHCK